MKLLRGRVTMVFIGIFIMKRSLIWGRKAEKQYRDSDGVQTLLNEMIVNFRCIKLPAVLETNSGRLGNIFHYLIQYGSAALPSSSPNPMPTVVATPDPFTSSSWSPDYGAKKDVTPSVDNLLHKFAFSGSGHGLNPGANVEGISRLAADVDEVERRVREYEQGLPLLPF